MFGQGIAGILACALNIAVLLALGGATATAAMVYYLIAALAMAGCIASYLWMLQRPFTKYWISRAGQLPVSYRPSVDGSQEGEADKAPAQLKGEGSRLTGTILDDLPTDSNASSAETRMLLETVSDDLERTAKPVPYSFLGVARSLWLEAFSVWLVFLVTFAVFPGIIPFHLYYGGDASFNMWWQQVNHAESAALVRLVTYTMPLYCRSS